MKCSIVIPAYNEEAGIGFVLDELQKILSKTKLKYEIIVVEDGSTDSTERVVMEKACTQMKEKETFLLVKHDTNKGYGAALKTGIKKASNDLILIMDADGSYPAIKIPAILAHAEKFDMVVAARKYKGFHQFDRRIGKLFLTMLANCLLHAKILDLNSGLRVFRKSMVQNIFNILPSGFSFTTTITLEYLKRGYSIKYVPISYQPRVGTSKINPLRDFLKLFSLIIKTSLRKKF